MTAVGVVASVLLGLAFVVAGGSKLAAAQAWPAQAEALGAPRLVIPVVPWVELVIGAGLIAQLAQPIPAVAALVLLVVFTILIAVRLAQGKRPSCACFGAWSAKPIGAGHLLRNGALIALGVLAVAA